MCGLVGVAGNVSLVMKDVFNELLLVDVLRGAHSTGAAAVKRHDNDIVLHKDAIPSPMFIGTKEYQELIKTYDLKALIGHNRYATVGAKTAANAHPFVFPNLVGAHNGTLDKWIATRLEASEKYGTDSETLYHNINLYGLKKTIGEVSGAWALTFFDKTDNSINLLRNKERPLYYTYSDDRETLLWASESYMLEWILVRNRVKLLDNKIFECAPNQHYKWTLPKLSTSKFEKPLCAEVLGQSYAYYHSKPYAWYDDNTYVTYPDKKTETTNVTLHVLKPKPKQKKNTKKFRPPYIDAYGIVITKPQFLELVDNGCVFCDQTDSVWGDFILPLKNDMDGRKLYLCEACYNDDDIRELVENAI